MRHTKKPKDNEMHHIGMTHGDACPIWLWLSGGYYQNASERESNQRHSTQINHHPKEVSHGKSH